METYTFHVLLHVVEHGLPHTPVTVQYEHGSLNMRRAFSSILLTNQAFPEFVGPQTMNEDGVSNCNRVGFSSVEVILQSNCVTSYLSLFKVILSNDSHSMEMRGSHRSIRIGRCWRSFV